MPRPPGIRVDGPKIRRIRIRRGITVTDLASRIGRARGSIWNIEAQDAPVSEVFVNQLANALGVSVEDITKSGDGEETPAEALASLEKPRPAGD